MEQAWKQNHTDQTTSETTSQHACAEKFVILNRTAFQSCRSMDLLKSAKSLSWMLPASRRKACTKKESFALGQHSLISKVFLWSCRFKSITKMFKIRTTWFFLNDTKITETILAQHSLRAGKPVSENGILQEDYKVKDNTMVYVTGIMMNLARVKKLDSPKEREIWLLRCLLEAREDAKYLWTHSSNNFSRRLHLLLSEENRSYHAIISKTSF